MDGTAGGEDQAGLEEGRINNLSTMGSISDMKKTTGVHYDQGLRIHLPVVDGTRITCEKNPS